MRDNAVFCPPNKGTPTDSETRGCRSRARMLREGTVVVLAATRCFFMTLFYKLPFTFWLFFPLEERYLKVTFIMTIDRAVDYYLDGKD